MLSRTGATYAQVKDQLLGEFVGPLEAPRRPDDIKILPDGGAPASAQNGGAATANEQDELTPSLEELVVAAVTAATRGHAIQITGLTETVEALGREVRDLKTRVIALEGIALRKRGRWPFGG